MGFQFRPALHPGKMLPLVGKTTSLFKRREVYSEIRGQGWERDSEEQNSGNLNKRQERRALRSDGKKEMEEIHRKAKNPSLDPRYERREEHRPYLEHSCWECVEGRPGRGPGRGGLLNRWEGDGEWEEARKPQAQRCPPPG